MMHHAHLLPLIIRANAQSADACVRRWPPLALADHRQGVHGRPPVLSVSPHSQSRMQPRHTLATLPLSACPAGTRGGDGAAAIPALSFCAFNTLTPVSSSSSSSSSCLSAAPPGELLLAGLMPGLGSLPRAPQAHALPGLPAAGCQCLNRPPAPSPPVHVPPTAAAGLREKTNCVCCCRCRCVCDGEPLHGVAETTMHVLA